nr:MAG TPA: hypothetical protein [Caudoviricetes sp.]
MPLPSLFYCINIKNSNLFVLCAIILLFYWEKR